jgi:hypothetical protein
VGAAVTEELHHYRLFGLHLVSDQPLGTLPIHRIPKGDDPDVRVLFSTPAETWARVQRDAETVREIRVGSGEPLQIRRTPNEWLWSYPDDTHFLLAGDGREIRLKWPTHYVVEDALTYLLGPILGFTLRLRGVRALHASCVQLEGRAFCFVGARGAGKSTLAAALYSRGHGVLSEDVTALRDTTTALPGVPLIKLWEDTAALHGELPLLTPNWSKHYLPVEDGFVTEATRLGGVYLLGLGPAPVVESVRPGEALAALLDNVYVSYALSDEMRAEDLDFFGDLVEQVPVRRLNRTASFDDLDALTQRIESDVATSP